MSKTRLGLVLALASILVVRLVVYLNPATAPGMTPEQIWYGMSATFKSIVLLSAISFVWGIIFVIKGLTHRSDHAH